MRPRLTNDLYDRVCFFLADMDQSEQAPTTADAYNLISAIHDWHCGNRDSDAEPTPASPNWAFDVSTAVILRDGPDLAHFGREAQPTLRCTLAEYFDANNAMDADERAEIRAALRAGRIYRGGGGAAPIFTIEREDSSAV